MHTSKSLFLAAQIFSWSMSPSFAQDAQIYVLRRVNTCGFQYNLPDGGNSFYYAWGNWPNSPFEYLLYFDSPLPLESLSDYLVWDIPFPNNPVGVASRFGLHAYATPESPIADAFADRYFALDDWAASEHARVWATVDRPARTSLQVQFIVAERRQSWIGDQQFPTPQPPIDTARRITLTIPRGATLSAPYDIIAEPTHVSYNLGALQRVYQEITVNLIPAPPLGLANIHEDANSVNLVFNATAKDDPPQVPRNTLYTVVTPNSLDYRLQMEMQVPDSSRTNLMWAAVNGDGQIAGQGFFPPSGAVDMVFSHNLSQSRAEYDIFVGWDLNFNEALDVSERIPVTVPQVSQPLRVHGISASAYEESRVVIATGAVFGGALYPLAEALLDIFYYGDPSQAEEDWRPTSSTTCTLNCFYGLWSDWLTHNAGAEFSTAGNATLTLCTWNSTTEASQRLAGNPAITDEILAMYLEKSFEMEYALEGLAVGEELWFPSDSGWYSIPVTRVTFSDVEGHADEHLALARARMEDFRVRFKVRKTAGSMEVTKTIASGVVQDLYDFNYIAGDLSIYGATVQLAHGNGTFGGARGTGQIYRNRFELYKSWDYLP